eukprot:COSAG05_NODE_2640_length_2812_cov_471.011680_3_plen_104_part_00
MRTNHGGGYQWRIAPAKGALTEAVFQKTVLPFEGMSSLRWGGKAGKQLFFNATRISHGTVPTNSTVRLLLIMIRHVADDQCINSRLCSTPKSSRVFQWLSRVE